MNAKTGRKQDIGRLNRMTFYCITGDCLRGYILGYFGEQAPERCGNCSNCLSDDDAVDVTDDAEKVINCIAESGERFGTTVIVDTLRGKRNEKAERYGLLGLDCFGALSDRDSAYIRSVIDLLLVKGIAVSEGEYPVLRLTEKGEKRDLDRLTFRITKKVKNKKAPKSAHGNADPELFAALRSMRTKLSAEEGVPPYFVFSDATLTDMAIKHPTTKDGISVCFGCREHKSAEIRRGFYLGDKEFSHKIRKNRRRMSSAGFALLIFRHWFSAGIPSGRLPGTFPSRRGTVL